MIQQSLTTSRTSRGAPLLRRYATSHYTYTVRGVADSLLGLTGPLGRYAYAQVSTAEQRLMLPWPGTPYGGRAVR